MRLSVILPVYNLGNSIASNLAKVRKVLDRVEPDYELVPVDDGSKDDSASELRRVADERIRPVFVKRNAGKGNALKAGFAASRGELVLLLDGDLDIMPQWLPFFTEAMEKNGADIVVGSKRHPKSRVQYPWHRRLTSWVYFTLVRLAVGLPITDTQTGMKLFKRKVLGEALARMLVKTYAFDLELLSIAHGRGAKIVEAPVEIRFGEKFGCLKPRTVFQMAKDSLAVFYRLRFLDYYSKVEVPPPLDRKPLVSVVIACPRPSAMLDECLRGLAAQTWEDWEAIVLPDEPVATPDDAHVRWISTGKVRPAEKRNLGIEMARGEIVAFIDDDAYPDPKWLEQAVKYFSEPTIGAVGGPGVTPPGDAFAAKCGGRVYENVLVSGNYRYRYVGGRVRRDIDDYPSCNLFVRTDILRAIKGYRTDFWPGEDTLLCRDIVATGKRIVYDPWTTVFHHRRALFGAHLRQLGRYAFHRGYFVKRFPENSLHLSYFIPTLFVVYLLAGVPAATALVAFGGRIGAWPFAAGLILFAPLALYLSLVFVTTAAFSPAAWFMTFWGVVATHVTYGVRFVQGLCAKKAPCEFIGKDHL